MRLQSCKTRFLQNGEVRRGREPKKRDRYVPCETEGKPGSGNILEGKQGQYSLEEKLRFCKVECINNDFIILHATDEL